MKKRIISLLLMIVMIVSIVPFGTISASAANQATSFTPRLSAPTGGIYKGYWSNNCARYSYWRAYEILGYPIGWGGTLAGYRAWGELQGFPKSTNTPKVGALACWAGHIGVVESIDTANRKAIVSEGHSYSVVAGIGDSVQNGYKVVGYSTNTAGSRPGTWWCKSLYDYDSSGRFASNTSRGEFYGFIYLVADNYQNPTPAPTPAPSRPSLGSISASDIAKGRTVTFTWNAADRATGYKVAIRGAETKDIDVGNATSYSYVLSKSGTYSFYAMAYNSTGNSGWTSDCRSCTSHDPVTVKFLDWDGSVLKTQTVDYGMSATAPSTPSRKGYTFQGWDSSYYNVTANKTVKATYQIEKYTVNFLDMEGNLISAQKVEYGKDAVEPTDKKVPTGYEFVSWNSEAYKNVYTDASNKTINVQGIYKWGNDDLPIICSIASVDCQYDGYYVYLNLVNYDKKATKGRAIVSLKTASGKLVDMTESAAFSIQRKGTKNNFEVFIPSEKAGSTIEVIIVDSYSSGVPISEVKTVDISNKERWTYWDTYTDEELATEKANHPEWVWDSKTEYKYRNKEWSTNSSNTKDGWTYSHRSEAVARDWSAWSWSWIGSYDNITGRREVRTQSAIASSNYATQWNYTRYSNRASGGSRFGPCAGTWSNTYCGNYQERGWGSQLNCWGSAYSNQYGGTFYKYNSSSDPWYNEVSRQVKVSDNWATQYSYRDISYTYHFYRWTNWSGWSDTQVTANSDREVKTRTVYRYKSTSNATENDSGKTYSFSNKVDSIYAGKQLTLYIYKVDGASDYTNEFIGQTVIASDGSYSFNNFKLREEPTIKTGDFTVAIGIEGTSNLTEVGKIEAPVPTYSVKFYNWDGTILSEQTISEGKTATLPENPVREGYDFIGWDNSIANIKEDVELNPVFEKKQFTVTFIDWKNKAFVQQKFGYGDVLTPPDHSNVEGYNFDGWDKIIDGTFVVTEDMVVTAEYSKKSYSVKFVGFDGNVIDSQTVKFGEDAVAPDNAGTADDGRIFAGWQDNGYTDVNGDAYVYPVYYYETTAQMPTVTYEKDGEQVGCPNGEYNAPITITLSTNDENDVIYYSINGSDHNEEIEYTGPITIDKTCSITYYATGFGKNDSEPNTNYYCINTGDTMSDWMTIDELPEAVRNAIGQEDSDYKIEKEVGYRFKDLTETSDVATAKNLADNGWTLISTTYTDYSDWQDEKIDVDSSKLGFEVDTNNGATDGQKFRYYYSHYKYVDANGETKFSPFEVEGVDCIFEEMYLDTLLDMNASFGFDYNGEEWYNNATVATQYRSRYQISKYYKWTSWGVNPPISSDKRESETADIYRYTNCNYHIVTVYTMDYYPEIMFVKDGETIDITDISNLYGYDYKGLYSDENYKNSFDANKAVKESIELYAKYTPKTYNVTFKLPNGATVGGVQKVAYMEAAKDPGAYNIPGLIFAGWDKDFSCITEDTVVNALYFKESEYPRIALNRSSVVLYTGTYFDLIATITPSDLVGKEIEWSSSDPSVATVDEYGKVTALKAGQTVITAKVVENKETASCTITVQSDLASKLMLKEDSKLNRDDIGYIRRVKLQTPVSNVKNEFINENIKFINIDKDGNEVVLNDTDLIGTGTIVRLMDGSAISDEAKFVITGDVDGDGKCTLKDSTHIMQYLLETEEFAPYQIGASDVNGDGFVNNKDAALIARFIAKLDVING